MKTYSIIAGVNGVGKSSATGILKSQRNDLGYIINADEIAESAESIYTAGKTVISRINNYLTKGICFTQETTLSGHFIKNTIQTAKEKGYKIHLFYIGLNSYEESIKRIKNRVEKGGHDIPDEDVIRRYNKRFDDLLQVLPFCSMAQFYDNERGFKEVGEYKNGEITIKGRYKPAWFMELIKIFSEDDNYA